MDRQDHRLLEEKKKKKKKQSYEKGEEDLGSMASLAIAANDKVLPSRRNLFRLATRNTTERNETPSVDGSSQIHQKPLRVFPYILFSLSLSFHLNYLSFPIAFLSVIYSKLFSFSFIPFSQNTLRSFQLFVFIVLFRSGCEWNLRRENENIPNVFALLHSAHIKTLKKKVTRWSVHPSTLPKHIVDVKSSEWCLLYLKNSSAHLFFLPSFDLYRDLPMPY